MILLVRFKMLSFGYGTTNAYGECRIIKKAMLRSADTHSGGATLSEKKGLVESAAVLGNNFWQTLLLYRKIAELRTEL